MTVTISEALSDPRFLSGELWARSVLWREAGWAMRLVNKKILLGYGATVGRAMDELEVYTNEWELVSKDEVVEARRFAIERDP